MTSKRMIYPKFCDNTKRELNLLLYKRNINFQPWFSKTFIPIYF